MAHEMEERTPDRLVRSTKFRDSCGASPLITPSHAYQAGYVIGGLMQFTCATRWKGGSGWIESVMIADKSKQQKPMTLILFGVEPTTSVFGDGEEADISDADLIRGAGHVRVTAEHWEAFKHNALATVPRVGLGYQCEEYSLFGLLIARKTMTFDTASDLYILLTVEQD